MAIFFIYIVSFIWLIPFNFWLTPSHFDTFAPTTTLGRVILSLGIFISFLAAVFYIHRYQKDLKFLLPTPISSWKEKAKNFGIIFLLTFFVATVTLLITMGLGLFGYDINEGYSLLSHLYQNLGSVMLSGVLLWFLVALREEVIYRGLVFRYLLKKTSSLEAALIISSLIFSLLHFYQSHPFTYILAFLLGYLFALVYYHTGSLLYSISIHWAYDIFTFLGGSYLPNYLNLEPHGISGWGDYFSLIRIIALILIIVVFKIYMKKDKSKDEISNKAIA